MPSYIGIFGSRGHGRDTLLFTKLAYQKADGFEIVFVDDDASQQGIAGINVISLDGFREMTGGNGFVAIAVSDGHLREKIALRIAELGLKPVSIFAPQALISENSRIGDGTLVGPFSVISENVKLGKFCQVNTLVSIAHDCWLGQYVTVGPGACINGCVEIDDYAYVGSSAVIKQGSLDKPRKIGKGAVIGMGAVVIRDVPAGETWLGNPARSIR